MSIPVQLRCRYRLLRAAGPADDEGEFSFRWEAESGRRISVLLSYETESVTSETAEVAWPEEVVREIGDNRVSDKASVLLTDAFSELHQATRSVLELVKYHLRHYDLSESLVAVYQRQWAADGTNWRDAPMNLQVSVASLSSVPLTDATQKAIQAALDSKIRPLMAMRHLHRAKLEAMPHHKWIDATIAAELAVKEVLCRKRPEIAPLLLEVPSPPFSKMFGPLLKQYLGEASPYRKELEKGQTRRNTLVHRPDSDQVQLQEAHDYVSLVERAIFHLLSLLYPDDALIQRSV